jgi:hypothetical protein
MNWLDKWLRKGRYCQHPVDKLKIKGEVISNPLPKGQYIRHYMTFICADCQGTITKDWDSMTPKFCRFIEDYKIDIEESLFYGAPPNEKP